jgi:hypothetical protein
MKASGISDENRCVKNYASAHSRTIGVDTMTGIVNRLTSGVDVLRNTFDEGHHATSKCDEWWMVLIIFLSASTQLGAISGFF